MRFLAIAVLSFGIFLLPSCGDSTPTNNDSTQEENLKDGDPVNEHDNSEHDNSEQDSESDNHQDQESHIDNSKVTKSEPKDEEETQIKKTDPPFEMIHVEAEPERNTEEEETPKVKFHEYKALNSFYSKYVSSSGKVNYSSIKSNKQELDEIVALFKANPIQGSWSKNQKLCYWINAYNVFTIKLVTDNFPVSSITKIDAKPWDRKFIKLGGKTYSLNNIENDIIRKQFNEPRIHFALNCASKSCPILLNSAYMPSKLDSQLTKQTKRFLNDTSKNKFDGKKAQISKLFDWYKSDFTKNGTVIDFINKYRDDQLTNPKISYLEYSWDLNK